MRINVTIRMLLTMVLFQSCQSQTSFDLFKMKFSKKIDNMIEPNNLSLEDGKSEALILFGYDRFQTSSEGLLLFDGISMSGNFKEKNNNVILHYSLEDKIISMYELNLYTEDKAQILKETLNKKLGKPNHSSNNNDGLEMTVWKDDSPNIYYFLMSYNEEGQSRKTELTVIDMKNERANEWISFRSFNYYMD